MASRTSILIPAAVCALGFLGELSPASAFSLLGSTTTTTTTTTTTPVPAPTATPTGCTPMATTKAFGHLADTADYFLAPGGSFETGTTAGWTLSGGAKIVSSNESLGVTAGSKALQLGVGATATSPAFCVDESNPSFRFASKVSSLDGGYAALVVYRDAAGTVKSTQFLASTDGTFYNKANSWVASPIAPLATAIPLVQGGSTASVQLKFIGTTKAYGIFVGANATIDSVMVDPYRRG